MPNPRYNFADSRTIFGSLVCGAAVGSLAGGSWIVGMVVWLVVYVFAALSPWNHTTCPACGTEIHARASRCPGCGQELEP